MTCQTGLLFSARLFQNMSGTQMSKRLIAAACLSVLPMSAMAVDLDLPNDGGPLQGDFRAAGDDLAAALA